MILLIDNYDSFVFNLARYFERLGQETHVVRNDATDVAQIERLAPQAIVLSPGPCTPHEAGCSVEVVRRFAGTLPILGICLGHQAIGVAFGGQILRAPEPVHGRASPVFHRGESVFDGLPSPLVAGRYHSLVIDRPTLPACLRPTAWTADGTLMAVAHREWPVVGLQFHPESILTDLGFELLDRFLSLAGVRPCVELPQMATERAPTASPVKLPVGPVTF